VPRRRHIVSLVVVCVAGLAVLAWLNRPKDEPARATVDDAVRSFRAQDDGGESGENSGERALGVYRYETRGSESVQSPISDTTHDYDGVSTIVVSEGRCGEVERWQVLEGRWSEGESCAGPDGDRFVAAMEFHEFFGFEQEDSFRCSGIVMPRPPVKRGVRFSSSCRSEDASVSNRSRVIGFETITIAGEPFQAIHVESRSELEGEVTGTAQREEWRRRSDGLLLRRSASTTTDTSLGGGTHYTERYTIELLDPQPRR
jgi:hypothetical protein